MTIANDQFRRMTIMGIGVLLMLNIAPSPNQGGTAFSLSETSMTAALAAGPDSSNVTDSTDEFVGYMVGIKPGLAAPPSIPVDVQNWPRVHSDLALEKMQVAPYWVAVGFYGDEAVTINPIILPNPIMGSGLAPVVFDLYFDTTDHAAVGDPVQLLVSDTYGNMLYQEGHYVPASYGNVVTFTDVPAELGATYMLVLPLSSHMITPFREESEAVAGGSSAWSSEATLVSNDTYGMPDITPTQTQSTGNCDTTVSHRDWDNYDRESTPNLDSDWQDLAWGGWKYEWQYAQCSLDSGPPPGSELGLQDDFDDGSQDHSRWTYEGGTENGNCGSNSSPYALVFSGTSGRSLTTKTLDASSGGNIQFAIRHGTGTGGGTCDKPEPAHDDDFAFEYSTDSGSSWTRISTYKAGNHGSWQSFAMQIPPNAQTSSVQFRWIVLNYYPDTERDHWAIDDIKLLSSSISTDVRLADNFDDGYLDTTKWTYSGATESSKCGSTSGSSGLYFSGTGRNAYTPGLDVQHGGKIDFTIRHGTGTGGGPCDKPEAVHDDNLALEFSTDGGSTWVRLATYAAGQQGSWGFKSITIPSYAQSSATHFRWNVLNYYPDAQRDHWAIDDVKISALQAHSHNSNRFLKPDFGFGFRGENKVSVGSIENLVFAGHLDGRADTQCRPGGYQHPPVCWGHVAWLQAPQFFYKNPAVPGVEHHSVTAEGRASEYCYDTFSTQSKWALAIAGYWLSWLGIVVAAIPEEYCTVDAAEVTDSNGPGLGVKVHQAGSSSQEQHVAGWITTKYNEKADFRTELQASVAHRVWMKACDRCTDHWDSGTTSWTVSYPMRVKE